MMDHILSIKLISSSFLVRTTSLDGYRNVRMTTKDSLNTKPSLLDSYAGGAIFERDFPEISERNFKEFASNYCQTKTGIKSELLLLLLRLIPTTFQVPKGLLMVCSVDTNY